MIWLERLVWWFMGPVALKGLLGSDKRPEYPDETE